VGTAIVSARAARYWFRGAGATSPVARGQQRQAAATGSAVPDQTLHARLLEEQPTALSGEAISVADALELVAGGQLVNCAIGPAVRPGQLLAGGGVTPTAAQIAAELGRSLGVPSELLLEGRQGDELESSAAEVLTVLRDERELVLGLDVALREVAPGYAAVVDFTDASGTYYLAGVVAAVNEGGHAMLRLRVRDASRVQLRRFVRVPAHIAAQQMEVQAAPGQWRELHGAIVDLSLGGLGLLVDEPLSAEARVRLRFELPGRFGELAVNGRVIVPPGPAEAVAGRRRNAGFIHRRGVTFDPLSVDDLRRLQRALYYRQVELRRLTESSGPRRAASGAAAPRPRPWWKLWAR
jgi:hypothetical protein